MLNTELPCEIEGERERERGMAGDAGINLSSLRLLSKYIEGTVHVCELAEERGYRLSKHLYVSSVPTAVASYDLEALY